MCFSPDNVLGPRTGVIKYNMPVTSGSSLVLGWPLPLQRPVSTSLGRIRRRHSALCSRPHGLHRSQRPRPLPPAACPPSASYPRHARPTPRRVTALAPSDVGERTLLRQTSKTPHAAITPLSLGTPPTAAPAGRPPFLIGVSLRPGAPASAPPAAQTPILSPPP